MSFCLVCYVQDLFFNSTTINQIGKKLLDNILANLPRIFDAFIGNIMQVSTFSVGLQYKWCLKCSQRALMIISKDSHEAQL